MIPEPKRGGTRGQADNSDPDAGGVALKAWRGNSDVQKWAAVRHRRCRRFVMLSIHGFALRASPAVKHGVSPPGTVGEHEGYSAQLHPCISSMLLRILSFSTSPIVTLSHSLWYVCFCGYPHCTSYASTSTQSNASGGGALCVTAGDTRAKTRGNPWAGRQL